MPTVGATRVVTRISRDPRLQGGFDTGGVGGVIVVKSRDMATPIALEFESITLNTRPPASPGRSMVLIHGRAEVCRSIHGPAHYAYQKIYHCRPRSASLRESSICSSMVKAWIVRSGRSGLLPSCKSDVRGENGTLYRSESINPNVPACRDDRLDWKKESLVRENVLKSNGPTSEVGSALRILNCTRLRAETRDGHPGARATPPPFVARRNPDESQRFTTSPGSVRVGRIGPRAWKTGAAIHPD